MGSNIPAMIRIGSRNPVMGFCSPQSLMKGNVDVRANGHRQVEVSCSLWHNSKRFSRRARSAPISGNCPRRLPGNLKQKLSSNGKFSLSGTEQLWEHVNYRSHQRIGKLVSASLAGPGAVELAANIFQLATAFVVPFYTIMILAPKWQWTQKLIDSELTYLILGVGYIYLFSISCTRETFHLMFSSKYWLPELPGITRMFSGTITVASAWLHLLTADLFAGRQVFLDGVKHNVETRHSLILCLMMCPIGIFSHMITKYVTLSLRGRNPDNVEASDDSPPC